MRIFTIPGRLILLLNIIFILTTHSSISVAISESDRRVWAQMDAERREQAELEILEAAAVKENKHKFQRFFPTIILPTYIPGSREATQQEKDALRTHAPAAYDYWLAKARGPRGQTGLDSPTGDKGDTGPEGPQGVSGLDGHEGRSGLPGEKGPPGPIGETGRIGRTGPPGPIGAKGIKGATGEKGRTGPPGPTGARGIKGGIGPTGVRGAPGERGVPGRSGSRGEKGPTGERGYQGPRGFDGPRGPDGEPGRPGLPGLPGADGAVGQKGITGDPGEKGLQGEKGDKGDDAEILSDEFKAHAAISNALAVLGALTPSEKIPRIVSLGVGLTEGSQSVAVGLSSRVGDRVVLSGAMACSIGHDVWRATASINLKF